MQGFWNRIGTIQVVNGVPVDTLLIKDSDSKDYRQIKVYKDGNMVWLNNVKERFNSMERRCWMVMENLKYIQKSKMDQVKKAIN